MAERLCACDCGAVVLSCDRQNRRQYASERCRERARLRRKRERQAARVIITPAPRQRCGRGYVFLDKSIRATATRDYRVACPVCHRDKVFDTDWLGRVIERCACGVRAQTPDDRGPMVRRYDQRARLEAALAQQLRTASRPSDGRHRGKRGGMRQDFRAEDAA